jgi:hypothetical protein
MQRLRRNGARGPLKRIEASARSSVSLEKMNVIR